MSNRVTLKQVAARAGVSYQTVSKVLNNQAQVSPETETRIWRAAEELEYHPNLIARSLRSQRSHMIGYSWEPTAPGTVNSILDQFLQSMVSQTERSGYHLLAFPYRPGGGWTENYRELMLSNRVDGFIISSVNYDDPRILFLLEQDFSFVAFGRSNPELKFPYVDVDGAAGMRMVIEHLISLGHCQIAILAWPETSRVGQNRMEGIASAVDKAGLALKQDLIVRGEGSYEFGYQAAKRWLELPPARRPTAIVALNDIMAIGAMSAVKDCGLQAGKDIAVTGFDDAPMVQYLNPPLTSVRQPIPEIGHRVITMLLDILNGNPPDDCCVLLEPRLIVRASSGGWIGGVR